MEDAHVAVLDLRAHPGYPNDSDTLVRAFFGVCQVLTECSQGCSACFLRLRLYLAPEQPFEGLFNMVWQMNKCKDHQPGY